MLNKKYFYLLIFVFVFTGAQTQVKKPFGYKYVIDKFFSKRQSQFADLKNVFLYTAVSIHRENTIQSFYPFSSFTIGYKQNIKEIYNIGDIFLKTSLSSLRLKKKKLVLLEFMPQISFPEIRTIFPVYVGMGAGLGFFPYNVVKKQAFLNVSTEFFLGLRLLHLYHNLGLATEMHLKLYTPIDDELNIYLEVLVHAAMVFSF